MQKKDFTRDIRQRPQYRQDVIYFDNVGKVQLKNRTRWEKTQKIQNLFSNYFGDGVDTLIMSIFGI